MSKCLGRDQVPCAGGAYSRRSEGMDYPCSAEDVDWLFRCNGCRGSERTDKYCQLFSVNHKGGTWCTPENCVRNFLQTDEGTSDRSHQALEAYIRQQMTRGTVEISGCLFGVSFEVVRIFQQEVEGKGG